MRKVTKPKEIPASLESKIVKKKRNELISEGKYIDDNKYNDHYKKDDVKKGLKELYYGKCVFCEQKVEAWQVEHFRPKSLYWWLAYSWDNLMYICPTCNQHKSNQFDILGEKVTYNAEDLNKIHQLCEEYDQTEMPLLINPEKEDSLPFLVFNDKGELSSENERVAYTIKVYKLDRGYLNDERKTLWDKFQTYILDIETTYPKEERHLHIKEMLRKYNKEAENEKAEFFAFRKICCRPLWNISKKDYAQ